MSSRLAIQRLFAAAQISVFALVLAFPSSALATENDVTLELRPHCDKNDSEQENVFGGPIGGDIPGITTPTDGSHCSQYVVADPLHRETPLYKNGEEIDMDLVIVNPSGQAISRMRGWIAYDPTILQGVSIEMQPSFTIPTPGESDFDAKNGVLKIGASAQTPQKDKTIKVARIKMKVISTPTNKTILSHDDVTGGIESHSAVISSQGSQETNILAPTLGSLIVRLDAPQAHQAASSAQGGASSSSPHDAISSAAQESSMGQDLQPQESSASSASVQVAMQQSSGWPTASDDINTTFTLLQIQNLRATTEGTAVFLAWDPLPSKDLTGYNIYYSTTSGRYIQRRSIDSTSTTLTIRGLMEGQTYFFAVRGVNAKNQETQFSKEVGIRVGSPETSTNPLAASAVTQKGPRGNSPRTGGTIAGESGTSSAYIVFFAACGVIGTLMAFRRQFVAAAPAHA
jgi:hypothetical protein